jgi:probable DNA metabolism protein
MHQVEIEPTLAAWRRRARLCLAQGLAPQMLCWSSTTGRVGEQQRSLFAPQAAVASVAPRSEKVPVALRIEQAPVAPRVEKAPQGGPQVPQAFLYTARAVACHRDPGRWDLLYRMLWRLTHGEPQLLEKGVDSDTLAFFKAAAAVRRDVHKCHAFVRFRQEAGRFVAWYRPDHFILPLAAPHFVSRFGQMNWSIVTADASVHWDGSRLRHGPGEPQPRAQPQQQTALRPHLDPAQADPVEELWKLYYAAIFNPARLKTKAMRNEMPRRYWRLMPETQLIDQLVKQAPVRLQQFAAALPPGAAQLLPPPGAPLQAVRQAAAGCRVCDWCHSATQTVFGVGPADAAVVVVGEQPGDSEDLCGQPFVGPAGQVLRQALHELGLPVEALYMTNAVKHFKWTPRGKKRLHLRPNAADLAACRPWLGAEVAAVAPTALLCLGQSAAQSVLGKAVKLQSVRGTWQRTALCDRTLFVAHPASILRAGDPEAQRVAYAQWLSELQTPGGASGAPFTLKSMLDARAASAEAAP